MDGVVLWVTIHEHDMLMVRVEHILENLLSEFETININLTKSQTNKCWAI
jgi:hypothetical protein